MPNQPSKADALLDAQVAWACDRLTSDQLLPLIAAELDRLLADARQLKLGEAVSLEAIQETARKYVAQMKIGGALPVLVGDIARVVYEHPVHDDTALKDLLPDQDFREILDKALEMQTLREAIIRESVSNPVYAELITELLYSGIRGYVAGSERFAKRVPGASSALKLGKAMLSRANPELGSVVEENLKAYVNRNTQASLKASEQFLNESFASEEFRQMVLDMWHANKHLSVAELRGFAGSVDIEELFVILYEYWQRLRRTDFIAELVDAGIKTFYDKYRQRSLATLLEDIGLDRDMMLEDAMRFAPRAIAALQKKELLAPLIRSNLADFYASDEVRRILGD